MKKVFLTVLTVVLFSVSGWANTIIKDDIKIDAIEFTDQFVDSNDCSEVAFDAFDWAYANDYNDEQATWYANLMMAACYGYTFERILLTWPSPTW